MCQKFIIPFQIVFSSIANTGGLRCCASIFYLKNLAILTYVVIRLALLRDRARKIDDGSAQLCN